MGQECRIGAVRNISALPARADVGADIIEPPVSAKSGREQAQQRRAVARLFDHLVGAGEQRRRHLDAERLRGGQIDNQLELGRLLDRKVGGLRPA
jgi:hypothetical protein